MTQTNLKNQPTDTSLARRILDAIQDIRYGSVEVTIHDAKVVQIERREKLRFDQEPGKSRKD
jgi:hypothetical protein